MLRDLGDFMSPGMTMLEARVPGNVRCSVCPFRRDAQEK